MLKWGLFWWRFSKYLWKNRWCQFRLLHSAWTRWRHKMETFSALLTLMWNFVFFSAPDTIIEQTMGKPVIWDTTVKSLQWIDNYTFVLNSLYDSLQYWSLVGSDTEAWTNYIFCEIRQLIQISVDFFAAGLGYHHGNSSSPWTKWPPFWQTRIPNEFSWMHTIEFRFEFNWNLSNCQ